MPSDLAGNTLTTARGITIRSTNQSFNDFVGLNDSNDYYRFSLSSRSSLSLELTGLQQDADIQMLDRGGTVVAESRQAGSANDTIATTLGAGTYYIRVYPYSGSTNYRLNLSGSRLPPVPQPVPSSRTARWTFMVYMAADDLEDFALDDFLEMAQVGSSRDVNVVVQLDRALGVDDSFGNWTETRRGLVTPNSLPGANWGFSLGELNMGATSTLQNFIHWSTSTYRAENYSLLLWGHGDGRRVAVDDNTGDGITASELSSALANVSRRMSLIGTDACSMGMLEFAYQIRNQASVLVGSQELVPGAGFNYTTLLRDLVSTPTMNAVQLGTTMVNRYAQHYSLPQHNSPSVVETLSAINLTSLNNLATSLSQFASTFMRSSTLGDRFGLESHSIAAGSLGNGNYPQYRDLGLLFRGLATDSLLPLSIRLAAQSVLNAYSSTVIRNYTEVAGWTTGLSINLQGRGERVPATADYAIASPAFAANTVWDEFLLWWAVV
jgi:hypothetical protein